MQGLRDERPINLPAWDIPFLLHRQHVPFSPAHFTPLKDLGEAVQAVQAPVKARAAARSMDPQHAHPQLC